jgi:hypothetical protein
MSDHANDCDAPSAGAPVGPTLAIKGPLEQVVVDWTNGAFVEMPGAALETEGGDVCQPPSTS